VRISPTWYANTMSEQGGSDAGSDQGDDRDEKRQEMRQAWGDVGDRFSALSETVRRRGASGAAAGGGGGGSDGGDGGALRDAFDKVMGAVRDFGEQASTVVKDPEVRAHTRDVAQSLNAALSATVDRIGGEVDALARKAKRTGRTEPPADPGAPSGT
jgi:hypothetical protein